MQRDFKIGIVLGLVLVAAVTLWLSTRPSLSPEARVMRARAAEPAQDPARQPIPGVVDANLATGSSPVREAEVGQPGETASVSAEPRQQDTYDSTVYEKDEKIKTRKFHIVRRGETLSAISAKYYGSANKWLKIFDANRSRVPDANRIIPGTKLIIPD
jgi:nucleoid-associated protein YgaU